MLTAVLFACLWWSKVAMAWEATAQLSHSIAPTWSGGFAPGEVRELRAYDDPVAGSITLEASYFDQPQSNAVTVFLGSGPACDPMLTLELDLADYDGYVLDGWLELVGVSGMLEPTYLSDPYEEPLTLSTTWVHPRLIGLAPTCADADVNDGQLVSLSLNGQPPVQPVSASASRRGVTVSVRGARRVQVRVNGRTRTANGSRLVVRVAARRVSVRWLVTRRWTQWRAIDVAHYRHG
jgi:hypothetical protein